MPGQFSTLVIRTASFLSDVFYHLITAVELSKL